MKAAVYSGNKQSPTEIKESLPTPTISADEILIKSKAFAINPTDWKSIDRGTCSQGDILGCDVSGIVVEVGKNVPHFAKGDFVGAFVRLPRRTVVITNTNTFWDTHAACQCRLC